MKQQKSILIRPSIKIIHKLQTVTQFLIASQSVTGSTEPLSSCTIGSVVHITYSLNCCKPTKAKLAHVIKENNTFAPHPFCRISCALKSSSPTQIKLHLAYKPTGNVVLICCC